MMVRAGEAAICAPKLYCTGHNRTDVRAIGRARRKINSIRSYASQVSPLGCEKYTVEGQNLAQSFPSNR